MEHFESNYPATDEHEQIVDFAIKPPYIEGLARDADGPYWQQFQERQAAAMTISTAIETLFARRSDDLMAAHEEGELSAAMITSLYDSLSSILSDPDYARLALYIPVGFLRPVTDEAIWPSYERFAEHYLTSWWSLLSYRDNAADFIDGDLPDDRSQPIRRVVKAAHLLPILIEHRLLTDDDVDWLRAQAEDDDVLTTSINDAMSPEMLSTSESLPGTTIARAGSAAKLYEKQLEKLLLNEGNIPENRRRWLAQNLRDILVCKLAEQITSYPEATRELAAGDSFDRQIALIAYEKQLINNAPPAEILPLFEAGLDDDDDIRNQAIISLRRLCRSGIVNRAYLQSLDIALPRITGDLSENVMTPEIIENAQRIVAAITNDTELSRFVYPVVLIGGSSLKGYAAATSDVDLAVLIKPGTPRDDLENFRKQLTSTCDDHVMELWLDKTADGSLAVHSFDTFDFNEADNYWTHTLFQSVWMGDARTIDTIQQHLLPQYFEEDDHMSRYVYLRRLEQDILQYRLLHKGYARSYSTDQTNTFMDPGYRLLATQLYAEKVFLPKSSQI